MFRSRRWVWRWLIEFGLDDATAGCLLCSLQGHCSGLRGKLCLVLEAKRGLMVEQKLAVLFQVRGLETVADASNSRVQSWELY